MPSPRTACLQVSTKVVGQPVSPRGSPLGHNQTAVSDGSSSVSPGIEASRISPAIGTGSAPMLHSARRSHGGGDAVAGVDPRQFGVVDKVLAADAGASL